MPDLLRCIGVPAVHFLDLRDEAAQSTLFLARQSGPLTESVMAMCDALTREADNAATAAARKGGSR